MRNRSLTLLAGLQVVNCMIGFAVAADYVTVARLKAGAVCRNANSDKISDYRPPIPFQAEVSTYDRVKTTFRGRDCFFNPGEYTLNTSGAENPRPSGRVSGTPLQIGGQRGDGKAGDE
jgi:hypothetical protein